MKRTRSSSGKNKRPVKRAKTTQQVAQAAVRKELRKISDFKVTDNAQNNVSVSASGSMTSLLGNLIRGDAGVNNFDGNVINPCGIRLKYFFNTDQSYNACRIILFQWFDSTVPTAANVLQNTATGLGTISDVLESNKKFIKILHDNTVVIAPTANNAGAILGQGISDCYDVYIPGKRIRQIKFASSSATVQDGNLYCLCISDDSLVSFPGVNWYTRVTFTDS